ncbi:hypothetical protein [Kitasatospora indigofera]|uniref:hypothetical protein n=1 Tax=Kitasatospora indigofera TaxID=67307 RepID=UPI0033B6B570
MTAPGPDRRYQGHPPPPNTVNGPAGLQYGPNGVQVNVPAPAGLGRGVVTLLVLASAVMLAGTVTLAVNVLGTGGGPALSGPQSFAPGPGANPGSGPAAAPAPDGASGPAGAPSAAGTPSAAAPATAAQGVRWQGKSRLSILGLRLDGSPPAAGDGQSFDVKLNPFQGAIEGEFDPAGLGNLMLWTGRGTPTARQCADGIAENGTPALQVAEGSMVCVRTRAGRVGLLTIASMGTDYVQGGTADVIVWSEIFGRS